MVDKVLNLKLKYKDKVLDVARHKRDFTNKFYIGNDRDLFWQILDKAFPRRYNLISKIGSSFKLKLRDDMSVTVIKDNQELGIDDLKRANLMKGKSLTLDPSTTGHIDFSGSWEIEYSFINAYTYTPTMQEISIAKQFAKFPPPTPQQKFTRIFVILGLLVTWAGLYFAESTYVPPLKVDFAERMQRIEDFATQVQPEIMEVETEGTVDVPVGKSREEMEVEVTEQVEQAQAMTSAQFEQEFGLALDVGGGIQGGTGTGDFSNELLEVTEVSEIVAQGSGGPGAGTGPKARRGATDLDLAGSGGFDLEGSGDGLGGLGDMEGLGLGGTGGFEEVDMASLGGDVGSYNITKVESRAQFKAVQKRFAGIKMVKEGSIQVKQTTSPQTKSIVADIDRVVATLRPQIEKLFARETMIMEMYGTVEFSIIINKNGKVEAVDTESIKGSYFTDSFLTKCREIILNWKIPVKDPIGYSFRMKFMN
ncbi:MAG: hypothetical protein PF570_07605 [Candidatus Cloacimonetes bacterium]|jgi:hypothetical protein|nr:hypothetical protein [Candidatus Cloacimonadota bacterium]